MTHTAAVLEPLWPGAAIQAEILAAPVSTLEAHEIFVFGSNGRGFHGAGSAGLACRGEAANTWRADPWFRRAMAAPPGDPARVGLWAVYGIARGYQEGRAGRSYAVQTVERPGARRSTSRREIYSQLVELVGFARHRPEATLIVTPLGEGRSGYTRAEMEAVWRELHARHGIPANLRFVRLHGRDAGPDAQPRFAEGCTAVVAPAFGHPWSGEPGWDGLTLSAATTAQLESGIRSAEADGWTVWIRDSSTPAAFLYRATT